LLYIISKEKRRDPKVAILKENYPVLGMTCAACVSKIESVLEKTDGIKEVSVNFASESVMISYEDQEINIDRISKIIKDLGYELLN